MSSREHSPPSRHLLVTVFSARLRWALPGTAGCTGRVDASWSKARLPFPSSSASSIPPSLPLFLFALALSSIICFHVCSAANTASLWVQLLDLLCWADFTIGWKREAVRASHIVVLEGPLCTRNILNGQQKGAVFCPADAAGTDRHPRSHPGRQPPAQGRSTRLLTMAPWCGRAGASLTHSVASNRNATIFLTPFRGKLFFSPI